ncbi:hypothetical protein Moror_14715 [Moniliophthora roreri MCA 2997]|uniref:Uncharacterized protein n=2 Tax=Moniliophthora roreri TaxID=221103 RepID=V2X6M7_MONRO|nr:hypothetical protein Moror_14715 [Moniliophthora roreri MCA 2997]
MESVPDLQNLDKEMVFEFSGLNSAERNCTYKLNKMMASGPDSLQALAKLLCHSYSGKKREQLLKELKDFSQNRERWNLLQHRAQHAHKGPWNMTQTEDNGMKK